MKLSERQEEVLALIVDQVPSANSLPCEWGDIWSRYDGTDGEKSALHFRNFDRVADALRRKGLIDDREGVEPTDLGRRIAARFTARP